MRYELNFDDDKIIDIEAIGDDGVLDLNDCCKIMNEQQDKITELEKNFDDLVNWASEIANRNVVLDEQIGELQRENKQLRKQMQNYEQLIANSYVGEEETLDGFVGKYVIWEDELQKYREKIKKGD